MQQATLRPTVAQSHRHSQASRGKSMTMRGRIAGGKPTLADPKAKRAGTRADARLARAEEGDSLEEFLMQATKDDKLRRVMLSLAEATRTISYRVRTASCSGTACLNSYGDEQLAVDLLADKILFEALKHSGVVAQACSEEVPEPVDYSGSEGYAVAFDPLDGSSIVDCNFSVGSIFGVWPGDQLQGQSGRSLAASGMGVYGPRTAFIIALDEAQGAHEFLLADDGKWVCNKVTESFQEGKMFAPGNLRAIGDYPEYEKLVSYYLNNNYTLRYSGGLVPDVFQLIVKEKGVFTNVQSPSTKAKLRLTFEVAPIAFLIEKAGGHSSADSRQVSALDISIDSIDQRSEVCMGSYGEVKRFEEFLFGNAPRFSAEPAAATA